MSELIGLLIFAGLVGFLCAIALRGTVNAIAPEPDGEPRRTPEQRFREGQGMSLADAFISLAKTQRRLAGEYAAEIKDGLHAKCIDQKRTEIARLRKAVKENLNWARREREET